MKLSGIAPPAGAPPHDGIAAADGAAVIRGADGVPVEGALLEFGDNPPARDGRPGNPALSAGWDNMPKQGLEL